MYRCEVKQSPGDYNCSANRQTIKVQNMLQSSQKIVLIDGTWFKWVFPTVKPAVVKLAYLSANAAAPISVRRSLSDAVKPT